ncbi:MAG: hypothetical protein ACOX2S_09700, partial [bacterium]
MSLHERMLFQSSPRLRCRVLAAAGSESARANVVSILTRLRCRVLAAAGSESARANVVSILT